MRLSAEATDTFILFFLQVSQLIASDEPLSSLRVVNESFTLELSTTGQQGRFLFASHVLVLLWMTGQEGIYCTALLNIPFLFIPLGIYIQAWSWFHVALQDTAENFCFFNLMENMLELCSIFIDLFWDDIVYFLFVLYCFTLSTDLSQETGINWSDQISGELFNSSPALTYWHLDKQVQSSNQSNIKVRSSKLLHLPSKSFVRDSSCTLWAHVLLGFETLSPLGAFVILIFPAVSVAIISSTS